MKRALVRIGIGIVVFNALMAGVALALRRLIPSTGDEASDDIALAAVANGIDLRSRAASFRGGSARAIMGGLQLDLTGATLDPAGARLEVSAIMGGVQVIIPDAWRTRVRTSRAVLGGIEHPSDEDLANATGPILDLDLRAILGGVEVRVQPEIAAPARAGAQG
jgi:hypothetical protein